MATILIPTPLRKFTNNLSKIEVCGGTVADSLQQLTASYPDLARFLVDEGGTISQRVHIFMDNEGEPIREIAETTISHKAVLNIVPAIKGGQ